MSPHISVMGNAHRTVSEFGLRAGIGKVFAAFRLPDHQKWALQKVDSIPLSALVMVSAACAGGIALDDRPSTTQMGVACRDGVPKGAILKHKMETDPRWSPHERQAIKAEDASDWKWRAWSIVGIFAVMAMFFVIWDAVVIIKNGGGGW